MEQLSMSYDQLSSRPGSRDRSMLAVLQSQWRDMSYNEETKDFVLIVGERREELTVHKLVLMVRCEKLTASYLANKKEIEYEFLDPASMRKVLQYLYTAEIDIADVLEIIPLLHICNVLGLHSLQSYLVSCVDLLLTVDSICAILAAAHQEMLIPTHDDDYRQLLWNLCNSCIQFAGRYPKEVLSSQALLEMNKMSLIFLASSKLPTSAGTLAKSVLRWGEYQITRATKAIALTSQEHHNMLRAQVQEVVQRIHVADDSLTSSDSASDGIYGIIEKFCYVDPLPPITEEAFQESAILSGQLDLQAQLNDWCGHHRWTLLYRASRDGFTAIDFHSRCDGHADTVVLVETYTGHIFGGYTDASWSSKHRKGKYATSYKSFLFSLINPSTSSYPVRYPICNPSYAINNYPRNGPIFGSGADLYISNNCHSNEDSYSHLPSSYGDGTTHPYALAGRKYFTVRDYEVFGVLGKHFC